MSDKLRLQPAGNLPGMAYQPFESYYWSPPNLTKENFRTGFSSSFTKIRR